MSSSYGPYFDGNGARHGDPLRIYRRLLTGLGGDPNRLLERYESLTDDEAREKITQAAGWALEMVPFDPQTGQGATEALVESTLRDFLGWLEGNASAVGTTVTWQLPTAAEFSPSTATPKAGCGCG